MAKSRCAADSILYIFSYLWFYKFFGQFCGVFVIPQNGQIAMRIMNIFEKFFNRMKEWYSKMSNPVVHPFWNKSYNSLMMVNILHCPKMEGFDCFYPFAKRIWVVIWQYNDSIIFVVILMLHCVLVFQSNSMWLY